MTKNEFNNEEKKLEIMFFKLDTTSLDYKAKLSQLKRQIIINKWKYNLKGYLLYNIIFIITIFILCQNK